MHIKHLRYLVELDRCGSMYAAAKRLMVSQQGLSKAIASLESELGLELVKRTSHGTRLTQEGLAVLDSAKLMLAEYDRMASRLYDLSGAEDHPANRISVRVSHYAAQIASVDPEYVRLLTSNTFYIEEPFDKLLLRAAASDGSDLVFTDVFHHTLGGIVDNPDVIFEPIIQTRYGLVWKGDSVVEGKTSLHRGDVCDLPLVIDSDRESMRLVNALFEKHPLSNVLMGTASQRMLFEYVQMADADVLALSDSFSFYVRCKQRLPEMQGLRFTPLATLKSVVQVGFVLPRRVQLTQQALHTMQVLRRYIAEKCPDYL